MSYWFEFVSSGTCPCIVSLANLSIFGFKLQTFKLHKFDDIDQHKQRRSSILLSSSLECTFIWKSFPRFPFAGKENYYLEFHCRSIISNGTRILHICYRNSKGQQPCEWGCGGGRGGERCGVANKIGSKPSRPKTMPCVGEFATWDLS